VHTLVAKELACCLWAELHWNTRDSPEIYEPQVSAAHLATWVCKRLTGAVLRE